MAETGRTMPIVRYYQGNLIVGTANAFSKAVAKSYEQLPTLVEGLGKALAAKALPQGQLKQINMEIAQQAQNAVVAGWRSRLPRQSISYRPEARLTGRLGPALGSPQMLRGTSAQVISFVNKDYLDKVAAHWYRVNYGAIGPNLAGGETAETYTLELNNRPFITLRDDLAPSRANFLPARFFWIKGPVNILIAARRPAIPGEAKGARAAHFLDLGFEEVAVTFGPTYQAFFNEYVQTEIGRQKLAKRNIQVVSDVRLESIGYSVTVH